MLNVQDNLVNGKQSVKTIIVCKKVTKKRS